MKNLESQKSHSWRWDSHINSKNSRWLADNLEEMDNSVKRMLKLIEDDRDSFAKKAETYYRKRPELISHVEDFYRMYRSLAERYDHLTVGLRKNIPSLQSQGSGMSEFGYEIPSSLPSPDLKLACRRSGQQPAGFEFFLGAGDSSSDNMHREADESSSLTDSDPDCDASSVNNYSVVSGNGGDQILQARVFELENELLDMKEKLLRVQHEASSDPSQNEMIKNGTTFQDTLAFGVQYAEELRIAKEKAHLSKEEISRLKAELRKYESRGPSGNFLDQHSEVPMVEELKKLKEKLEDSRSEILCLKKELENSRSPEKNQKMSEQLELAQKDAAGWRAKFNTERREVSKLQERLARLKNSLSDRDHEIRELKIAISDAEEKICPEKSRIKAEIARLVEERACIEKHLKEWESRGHSMEEEIRKTKAGMLQMEETLRAMIDQLKMDINDRDCRLLDLMQSFNAMQLEKHVLSDEVFALKADVNTKEGQILQMNELMHQLQEQHSELTLASDRAQGMVESLRLRVEELEGEVEKQRLAILEGAEGKREAIRQLCFSLEHYRSGYHNLRHAFLGHTNKQLRRTSLAY